MGTAVGIERAGEVGEGHGRTGRDGGSVWHRLRGWHWQHGRQGRIGRGSVLGHGRNAERAGAGSLTMEWRTIIGLISVRTVIPVAHRGMSAITIVRMRKASRNVVAATIAERSRTM